MDSTRSAVETFTQPLVAEICIVDGTTVPVYAELGYDCGDPYAVTVCFRTALGAVVWTFARDLLVDGLAEPSGDGDVHVWACMDDRGCAVVMLELCAPAGEALVQLPLAEVGSFADRMLAAVPPGTESGHLDLDRVIADLISARDS